MKLPFQKYIERIKNKPAYKVFRGQYGFFIALFFLAVIPILVSSNFIFLLQSNNHWFEDISISFYIIFFIISFLTMTFALIPTTVVAILTGHYLGWEAFPGLLIAYTLAAIAGLYFGRFLNTLLSSKRLIELPELQPFRENIRKNALPVIIFGRLSPVLPFAMMNVAFASLNPPFRSYLLGSIAGMLPRTLLFFYAGMQTTQIWAFLRSPSLRDGLELVPVFLVIFSTIGMIIVIKKILRN
ncbi:MAG: DedA family protein [Chitinophagaceae bacterium]|nr:MAG: DedA family protein [Chitinophagaceae bacterium]